MSTRLRDGGRRRSGPYPLGEIPRDVIVAVGRRIVHRLAAGLADITGDDFGTIFAAAIGGEHRLRPLGIADVVLDSCAWSVKTVKTAKPFGLKIVRLISGRNSPVYSQGIDDPFADIQKTGAAVLTTWNERVNVAYGEYNHLRMVVFLRNVATLEFSIMEYEAYINNPLDYTWELNRNRNFIGRDYAGTHKFTWQPHGSQLTIKYLIPPSARRFRIVKHIPSLTEEGILASIGYDDSWIETL